MTNEQILKQAISNAVENGWETDYIGFKKDLNYGDILVAFGDYDLGYESIIFSHSFAKSFFGNGNVSKLELSKHQLVYLEKEDMGWQYHLQQLVLEEEPLKYIEKFL